MLKQEKMTKWEIPGVPAGGLRTVGRSEHPHLARRPKWDARLWNYCPRILGAEDARNKVIGFVAVMSSGGKDLSTRRRKISWFVSESASAKLRSKSRQDDEHLHVFL